MTTNTKHSKIKPLKFSFKSLLLDQILMVVLNVMKVPIFQLLAAVYFYSKELVRLLSVWEPQFITATRLSAFLTQSSWNSINKYQRTRPIRSENKKHSENECFCKNTLIFLDQRSIQTVQY